MTGSVGIPRQIRQKTMSFHMEPTLALVKENEEFLSSLFAGSGEGLVVTGTDMLSPATLSVWGVC